MKRLLSIAVLALFAQAAHGQAYSLAGSCSGSFRCDHVTVSNGGGIETLQFTRQASKYTHYLIFAGPVTEGDTFQVNAVGKDGSVIRTAGQCSISKKICSTVGEHVEFHQRGTK